jgi:hypothetical protein
MVLFNSRSLCLLFQASRWRLFGKLVDIPRAFQNAVVSCRRSICHRTSHLSVSAAYETQMSALDCLAERVQAVPDSELAQGRFVSGLAPLVSAANATPYARCKWYVHGLVCESRSAVHNTLSHAVAFMRPLKNFLEPSLRCSKLQHRTFAIGSEMARGGVLN